MSIKYTRHLEARLKERGITHEQVEEVLASPERMTDDPEQGSVRLERLVSGRILKVWVVAPWPAGDRVVAKSAAWKD